MSTQQASRSKLSLMRPTFSRNRPFPLWLVFPLLFSAVYLSHWTLLRLPYYWDEAGYYIPAAFDFFRTGSLIPYSTLTNAHPPLPSIYLALWWWSSGFAPIVTRVAMCLIAALALLGVFRLALVATSRAAIAITTVVLVALYPIWFAQSTLAHADLFAAAGTLWGLALFLPADREGPRWGAVACFALAALAKETAIVTPLALAAYQMTATFPQSDRHRRLRSGAALLASLLPLCGWYWYHWHKTGFVFGNPQFLHYNATATLSPLRILLAFAHRAMHVTAHMNMFVPVLCGLAALMLDPQPDPDGSLRPALAPSVLRPLLVVLFCNLAFFSVVGGALLTRYLLPLYPIVLLFCVSAWYRRVRFWYGLAALSAGAFAIGLFVNPPYRFAPEDNLSYRDVIVLHQHAIQWIVRRYPGATVLTAWPATDELSKPELGYVRHPVKVAAIDDFSLASIQQAAALPGSYTAALAFSTKYDPPALPFSLGPESERLDQRYFGFHHDLSAAEIAGMLGGAITWDGERKGQWAAVLHFERPQLASLRPSNGESTSLAENRACRWIVCGAAL